MGVRHVRVRLKARQQRYEIIIGAGTIGSLGDEARRSLAASAKRIAVISNQKVFNLYGEPAIRSLREADFTIAPWLMGDGERYKSLRTLGRTLTFFSEARLERSDAVVALGGGVVGDIAGLAAALYLRGIGFIQFPTTLLAQIDASVGGKAAVNTMAGKNIVGAFHQPRAVLIDTDVLRTLPRREITAGWCEAIKQGAVGSRQLLDETRRALINGHQSIDAHQGQMIKLIAAQCAFKASIVTGDEREDLGRADNRSRRILNFGHTVAHALETVTHYRRFRHGEAVGYGMIAAGEISTRLGLMDHPEFELLRDTVRLAGRLPRADDLNRGEILHALASDKKTVGGSLKWVLLERLGRATLMDGRDIPAHLVRAALDTALRYRKGG
jgi:3-dehydroquinate synthase